MSVAYHVHPEHTTADITRDGVVPGFHGGAYTEPRVFAFRSRDEAEWYAAVQVRDAREAGITAPDGSAIRMSIVLVDVTDLDVGKDDTLYSGQDDNLDESTAIWVKGGISADRLCEPDCAAGRGEA